MSQNQIAETFRKAELERRSVRRQVILNTSKLANEPLTDQDRIVTENALKSIKTQQELYEAAISPRRGYLKTLWLAILGRL